MWGDDPEDYRARVRGDHGLFVPDLPTSQKIDDDWTVDLEWMYTPVSPHPIACVAVNVRFTGNEFRPCPAHVQEAALKVPDKLFARYRDHFMRNEE